MGGYSKDDDDDDVLGLAPAPTYMPAPEVIAGIPPGLEYLAQIDQLLVHQQVEVFECKF